MTVFRFINLKTKLFSLRTIGHRENRDVAQQNRKQSVLSDIYYFLNNICNMTIILQILFQKNNICQKGQESPARLTLFTNPPLHTEKFATFCLRIKKKVLPETTHNRIMHIKFMFSPCLCKLLSLKLTQKANLYTKKSRFSEERHFIILTLSLVVRS